MVIYKIFLLFLIPFVNIQDKQNHKCENIDKCIEIVIELSQDTIRYGEELEVSILYKNKTDSCLIFYPKAVIMLVNFFSDYDYDLQYLNDYLDATNPQELEPQGTFRDSYKTIISKTLVNYGINSLIIIYRCKEFKGDLKEYNTLCGYLKSSVFKLTVLK